MDSYLAKESRYETMTYNRCGKSGIHLPAISLGLWHNFGASDHTDASRAMLLRAFDLGINHFDLANGYGSPPGSAEETLGALLKTDLRAYRDELLISTKAGYANWPGPYGDLGSRKYLVASCDRSLKRLGVDYVDLFYHHRPDYETPLEETMIALDHIVRSGRALYVGISSYDPERTRQAAHILQELGTPCLVHQAYYNLFHRGMEHGLIDVLKENGLGSIVFCPLAQGLLTNRYINGIPEDSRAAKPAYSLSREAVTEEAIAKVQKLHRLAKERGQSLAQMSLAWVLRHEEVSSALIGASKVSQIEDNVAALQNLAFSEEELSAIDEIVGP